MANDNVSQAPRAQVHQVNFRTRSSKANPALEALEPGLPEPRSKPLARIVELARLQFETGSNDLLSPSEMVLRDALQCAAGDMEAAEIMHKAGEFSMWVVRAQRRVELALALADYFAEQESKAQDCVEQRPDHGPRRRSDTGTRRRREHDTRRRSA